MYDDSWYSILPDTQPRRDDTAAVSTGHRRRESLLKQPNDGPQIVLHQAEPLSELLEESSLRKGPPRATLRPRAGSYHHRKRSDVTKKAKAEKLKSDEELSVMNSIWGESLTGELDQSGFDDGLLDANQEEFVLYQDQLCLTERHIDTLINDTTSALSLLAGLSESFETVGKETDAFKSQCELLLEDQQNLKKLSNEVGDDLKYYSYLEPITRRLNAPGASRLVRDSGFVEMLTNLNNCIWFMSKHPEHRESETYLTRYISLLGRALSLFESQLTKDLNDRLEDIRQRRAEGSLNNTTLHALLYRAMSSEMEYNLRFIGQWAAEAETSNLSDYGEWLPLQRPSPATGFAKAQLANIIRGIVRWRRDLTVPVVQGLIDALNSAIEKKEDPMKASRTCIKAVLDLSKEELTHIHQHFFSGFWEVHEYMEPVEEYSVYLSDACKQVTEVVSQVVRRVDLQAAVELTNWIERCYVPDFSQYTNEREDTDTQLFEAVRKQLTTKMSRDIKEIILGRFAELVLRKIEKYEPSEEDLEIAPPFDDRRGSLSGSKVPVSATRTIPNIPNDELDLRAIDIVGEGYLTAYPPVKSAIRMLILHHEMFPASSDDETPIDHASLDIVEKSRFEIIHQTVTTVLTVSKRILNSAAPPPTPTKPRVPTTGPPKGNPRTGWHHFLFSIHNLYLLKQLILIYELHGVTKTSELDFTSVWTTLRDLRSRGQLLDPRAYYSLLREGKLMPKVVEQISDARVELDGALRSSIVKFTEGWAGSIVRQWKKEGRVEGGGADDESFSELRAVLKWTLVGEGVLGEGLERAVLELCDKGIKDGWMMPLRLSEDKTRPQMS